jgi:hypothetical protein
MKEREMGGASVGPTRLQKLIQIIHFMLEKSMLLTDFIERLDFYFSIIFFFGQKWKQTGMSFWSS